MDLNELADAVEALSGESREVDADVFKDIGAPVPFQFMNKLLALEYNEAENAYFARVTDDMQVKYSPPSYTASLDAAMQLVPEGWSWSIIDRRSDPTCKPNAQCWTAEEASTKRGRGATPALALTAACLRARAGEVGE